MTRASSPALLVSIFSVLITKLSDSLIDASGSPGGLLTFAISVCTKRISHAGNRVISVRWKVRRSLVVGRMDQSHADADVALKFIARHRFTIERAPKSAQD